MRNTFLAIGALLLAAGPALFVARLELWPQAYSQLVVGDLAQSGLTKRGEIEAVLILVFGFPAAWLLLRESARGYACLRQHKESLWTLQLACTAGLIWFGQVIFSWRAGIGWLAVCFLLLMWWLLLGLVGLKVAVPRERKAAVDVVSLTAVPIFAGFSVLGVAYLLNRLLLLSPQVAFWPLTVLAVGGTLLVWTLHAIQSSAARQPNLAFATTVSQFGVPLLAIAMIPAPVLDVGDVVRRGAPVSTSLAALVLLVAACAVWDVIARARRARECEIFACVSPVSVLLCLWILKLPLSDIPRIPLDDYHFGEALLPWVLWRDFGQIPFADVMPVRGFISAMRGAIASLLFGGNAADFAHIVPTVSLGLSALVFFAGRFAGGLILGAIAVLVLDCASPIGEIDYFYAAGVFVLAGLARRRWLRGTVIAWEVMGLGLFLLAPAQGLFFGIATLPLVIYAVIGLDRSRLTSTAVFGLAIAAVAFFPLLSPLGLRIAQGILRYFVEQVSINTTAYGISWAASFLRRPDAVAVVTEIFRGFGLFAVACLLAASLSRARVFGRASADRDWLQLALCAVALLTALMFLPRVLGRIDPGVPSRVGSLTLLLLGCLVPLAAQSLLKPAVAGGLAAAGFVIVSGIQVAPSGLWWGQAQLQSNALLKPRFLNVVNGTITDGQAFGLQNVGVAQMDSSHRERLQQLKAILDSMLAPGEPYYDLTNRIANYAYFGRPVPAAWPSTYYIADERAQLRAVREIEFAPVKILLLRASNIEHDGVSASLRAYWLYRYVLTEYVPFLVGEYIFAVHRKFAREPQFLKILDAGKISGVDLFERAFGVEDLKSIPTSWGHSYQSLETEFAATIQVLQVTRRDSSQELSVELSNEKRFADRNNFDMLHLTLECRQPGRVRINLATVQGQATASYSLSFLAASGTSLIPLGSRPSWIFAHAVGPMEFEPMATGCLVKGAHLLQRVRPKI